jgi:hypothetical protein
MGHWRRGHRSITLTPLSRTRAPSGRLLAMSLLTDLDAISTDHRDCADLEAGIDGAVVWMARDC